MRGFDSGIIIKKNGVGVGLGHNGYYTDIEGIGPCDWGVTHDVTDRGGIGPYDWACHMVSQAGREQGSVTGDYVTDVEVAELEILIHR